MDVVGAPKSWSKLCIKPWLAGVVKVVFEWDALKALVLLIISSHAIIAKVMKTVVPVKSGAQTMFVRDWFKVIS